MPTLDADVTTSPPRLTYLVKRLERAIHAHLDSVTRAAELTLSQYAALSVLKHTDGISSAALARLSFVSAQAMGEVISSLERKGLVTREPSPDHRRVLRILMTDEGARVLMECDLAVDEVESSMTAGLADAEAKALRDALIRCHQALTRTTNHEPRSAEVSQP